MTQPIASPHPASLEFFRPYTDFPRSIPPWFWWLARALALLVTLGMVALLLLDGPLGLKLFWGVIIPVVPALLVVAPGLWRQVCPLATLNQLPRRGGFSLERTVSDRWMKASFPMSVSALVVLVALREPVFNHTAPVLAGGVLLVLTLAFAGGLVFKGRSGWCGTFCPMTGVERTYGQAPLVVVPNGHCPTCLGCQPNCYDFNPRAAIFNDLLSEDRSRAWPRRLFAPLLLGLILGYFLQGPLADRPLSIYWATLLGSCAISMLLFWVLARALPLGYSRLTLGFTGAALVAFYAFAAPLVLRNLGDLLHFEPPALALRGVGGFGLVVAGLLLFSGLRNRREYRRQQARKPRVIPIGTAPACVTDRATGTQLEVPAGGSLLDAVRAAKLPLNYSCGSGLCGQDAITVCAGHGNLSAPCQTELTTLRRLGLEGTGRLACMARVQGGEITIDRTPPAPSAPSVPDVDAALAAGITRVVVVGNGVAGTTAAEALRRASPSVHIHIVGNETGRFYNRMALAELITGDTQPGELDLVPENWSDHRRVQFHEGRSVLAIDRQARTVSLNDGQVLPYDRLLLAPGAEAVPVRPDFHSRDNAFVLRSAADAMAFRNMALQFDGGRAVVFGGGVLGVETALALQSLGLQVLVLEYADRLMARQLDAEGSRRLTQFLRDKGIETVTTARLTDIEGDRRNWHTVVLADGRRFPVDLLMACLGVRPRTALAQSAGLACTAQGIVVDEQMHTSDPAIFAIGDAVDNGGQARLWALASEQAEAAVRAVFGLPADKTPTRSTADTVRLKCDELDVLSAGHIDTVPGGTTWTAAPGKAMHWRVCLNDGQVTGSLVVGPPGSAKAFQAALDGTDSLAQRRMALDAL